MRSLKADTRSLIALLVFSLAIMASSAGAQDPKKPSSQTELKERKDKLPENLDGVGIVEKLDAQIPMNLEFVDENGKTVKLGNYFQGDKPVILNLGYYRCPMLCNLIMNGMIEALKEIDMLPGRDFEIITLSIDPLETAQLAKHKKQTYIKDYGRPAAAMGWHFLTGRGENIKQLTETVGFNYKYVKEREEYAHGSAIMISTPDGKLSRYLYGIIFAPQTLRLSLVEASNGKIGTTLDKVTLYCFHYDADSGSYSFAAFNVMRLGGLLTVLILATVLYVFWQRERKVNREQQSAEGIQS